MQSKKFTNQLIREHSPYLLQHAHNPVNWYPWGEEALNKAAAEQKLLIISIGYSACHWCHVMEKESFEDTAVAGIMNDHFVSIKVDREERPDLDDIYMNACHLSSRKSCGWPLNALALADGRPFWAGTYFPKDQWMNILQQIAGILKNEPERLVQAADEIMKGIRQMQLIPEKDSETKLSKEFLTVACRKMLDLQDFTLGGRIGQPKFPMPVIYNFLLGFHQLYHEPEALKAVEVTLDNMLAGGIYDQLGGGFARYSVDSYWFAPHFEKMLYDNAQLVSLYSLMHRTNKNPSYERIIRETLEFAEREMMSPEGAFYSAIDADSEGEEGLFYVWKADEIRKTINDPRSTGLFFDFFHILEQGNWEKGKNILFRKAENDDLLAKYDLTMHELNQKIDQLKTQLFKARQNRIRPHTDHKILTSWNGLMLKAYAEAFKALGDEIYRNRAIRLAEFLIKESTGQDGMLLRSFGVKRINGFLDDYAHLIAGLIALYEITFEEKWINMAKRLTDFAMDHFYDQENGIFYFTSDLDPPLVVRNSEMTDNVIPGASSTMASNLYLLGKYYRSVRSEQAAFKLIDKIIDPAGRYDPSYYANWLTLGLLLVEGSYEVCVTGNNASEIALQMMQSYIPNCIFSGTSGKSELPVLSDKPVAPDQIMIYICKGNTCFAPVKSVDEAIQLIRKNQ